MIAVFVDGVGREERRIIPSLVPEYLFPRRHALSLSPFDATQIPAAMSRPDHHRFRLLGSNKTIGVYGFVFDRDPQYRLAYAEAIWTRASTGAMICQVLRELDRHIARQTDRALGPVYSIDDFIRPDVMRGVVTMTSLFMYRAE